MESVQRFEIDIEELFRSGLTVRYNERLFVIPGSKAVAWILEQFIEMQQQKHAASLN